MKNALKDVLIFIAGAAVGGAAVNFAMKRKYEAYYKEDMDSMKNTISELTKQSLKDNAEMKKILPEPAETRLYNKIVNDNYDASGFPDENYNDEAKEYPESNAIVFELPKRENESKPYIVSSDDYGSEIGFDSVTLFYYADGIIADDMDEVITDIDDVIGEENLKHIGEEVDNALYVRNEKYRVDYEILLDLRSYSDAIKQDYPEEG